MKFINSNNIKTIITSLVLFAGVPVALAWTAAPSNPPSNNTPAPLNVSISNQNKLGKLGLGGLAVFGKFQLIDGSEGAGKVLISDAEGKATWSTFSGGTGGVNTVIGGGSSTGEQKLAGWPNWVKCKNGNFEVYLDLASRGDYGYADGRDHVYYFAGNDGNGSNLGIAYNFSNGSFAELIHPGTAGPKYTTVMETCRGKSISQVQSGN